MDANYYLDIRILESSDDTDLKLGHIRNQIYSVIHGAFRKLPAHYALALEMSDKLIAKQEFFEKNMAVQLNLTLIFCGFLQKNRMN